MKIPEMPNRAAYNERQRTPAVDEVSVRVEPVVSAKNSSTEIELPDSIRPLKVRSFSARGVQKQVGSQSPLQQDPSASWTCQHRSASFQDDARKVEMGRPEISSQQRKSTRLSVTDKKDLDEADLDPPAARKSSSKEAGYQYSGPIPREAPKNVVYNKARTAKSRFVEPTISVRPDKNATQPPTPLSKSKRRAERSEDDEEDPFKDIDYKDNFQQCACAWTQWAAFIIIVTCLVCSLTLARLDKRRIWSLKLWKWSVLILVVFSGRLVSGWLIRLLVLLFERNFLLKKKVLYFVYSLRKGVQNCLWLGLIFLAWKLIVDPRAHRSRKTHKILSIVTKLMACLLFGAVLWVVKILLVKMLASSFHVSTFFDRIQESLIDQHILEVLSCPPFYESHMPRNLNEQKIKLEAIQKLNGQNVSAGHMKTLMNMVRHPGFTKLVNTIDESVSLEDDDKPGLEINSERQAKAVAKRIFKNVAQPKASYIVEEDLQAFMHEEEAAKLFSTFEGSSETGKITKKALKNWVVNVYIERKSLAHSLNDTKTAVDELHRMASVVASVIIIIVSLVVLGIASTHVLVFIVSQLLLVAFIFSNTLKQVFEGIVFLFVTHPYDVGDRCVVDGVQLVVEEMNILSTIFLKPDNEKVYYPNAVLATKPISNLYRSPEMKDALDYSVLISTSTKQMADLKDRITAYVEKNSAHWNPKFGMLVNTLEDMNEMRLTIVMQHTINFQNMGDRMNRRSDLLLELRDAFRDLGIEYRLLPQPIQYSSLMPPLPPSQQFVPTSFV